jgi:DNA polymerase III alpha subunit
MIAQGASELTRARVNAEIRRFVADTIAGLGNEGSVKERLWRAAVALGLPPLRVSEYHYGRVRRIEAHEAFQIIKNARVERARREREQFERARLEYEAYRLEVANSSPSALEWLLPPSVESLPDFGEGTEE